MSGNRLLECLSDAGRESFLGDCDVVELELMKILCESGERARYVYSSTAGFFSLMTALNERESLAVAMVGDEGMVGIPLFLGGGVSPQHALVQGEGRALRMSASLFRRHLKQSTRLRNVMSLYVDVFARELAQSAVCCRYHFVTARLARLLLMARDRSHSDHLHLTHERISAMLGVRREGVTEAARSLQVSSFIRYQPRVSFDRR